MRATEERYIGADESAGADGDKAGIEDCAIEVDKHICTETNIGPVIHTDGIFDPGILIELGGVLPGIG